MHPSCIGCGLLRKRFKQRVVADDFRVGPDVRGARRVLHQTSEIRQAAGGFELAEALQVLDPYLAKHPADQDRLMLAMRLLYDAAVAGKPIDSAAQDKARFARYFAAYEKTGGPQLALAAEWKKTVDK